MEICLSSFAFLNYCIEGAIRKTSELGYTAIEIAANRPHILPEDYSSSELGRVRSLLDEEGLKVAAITSSNGSPHWHFTHPNPKVRGAAAQHIRGCVDLAAELGAGVVETVSGRPVIKGVSDSDAWKWLKSGLQECTEYAKSHGRIIGLEAEPANFISTTDQAIRMIREVGSSHLKFLWDVGHSNLVREVNVPILISGPEELVGHVHLHDNDGQKISIWFRVVAVSISGKRYSH